MRMVARRVSRGRGEGEALVLSGPLSLLGGMDPTTGRVLDPESGVEGTIASGRVLVFPRGKGSTAGSYVLYALAKRGKAPAALICGQAGTVVATGAILGEVPMVDQVQIDLFRSGDSVLVDADEGIVELRDVEVKHVVTSFLSHRGRILILKRSEEVGSFRGHWAGVSGYIEGNEDPRERAVREIEEETGFSDVKLKATGEVVLARGLEGRVIWAVHPFIFEVPAPGVTLDWEHVEYRWIEPSELEDYVTVPKLREALESAVRALNRPSSTSL